MTFRLFLLHLFDDDGQLYLLKYTPARLASYAMRLATVATYSCTQVIRSRSFADSFCVVRINSNERAFPWVHARTWTKSEWVSHFSLVNLNCKNKFKRDNNKASRAHTQDPSRIYTQLYMAFIVVRPIVSGQFWFCCSSAVSVCKQHFCLLMPNLQCTHIWCAVDAIWRRWPLFKWDVNCGLLFICNMQFHLVASTSLDYFLSVFRNRYHESTNGGAFGYNDDDDAATAQQQQRSK